MNRVRILCFMGLWLLAFHGLAYAQSRPAPDDDVMRPTERGLRLTGKMAHGMANLWTMNDELWKDIDMSDDQRRQVADVTARRMLNMTRDNGKEYREGIEFLFETLISTQGQLDKIDPQRAREFGEKLLPVVRGGKEFMANIVDDARPILKKEQLGELQKKLDTQFKKVDKLEERMKGWTEGNYQPGENPFDALDDNENKDKPGDSKRTQQRRNAKRTAEWDVNRISGWEWGNLLAGVVMMFKFDAAQKAKGETILDSYRKKADVITTREWRDRVTRNRMLYNAQWQLGDVPRSPWIRQLDHEYDEATKPLKELTNAFVKEIMALPTAEQRAAALGDIRAVAEKNGLAFQDSDVAMLWLTQQ